MGPTVDLMEGPTAHPMAGPTGSSTPPGWCLLPRRTSTLREEDCKFSIVLRSPFRKIPLSSVVVVTFAPVSVVTELFCFFFPRGEHQYQDMLLLAPGARNAVPNSSAPPTPVSVQAPAPAPVPSNPPPQDAGPPFKKIRLGDAKQEMQPLRVDTRVCFLYWSAFPLSNYLIALSNVKLFF